MERLQVEKVNRLANHNQDFLSIVIRKLKGRNQKYSLTFQNLSCSRLSSKHQHGQDQLQESERKKAELLSHLAKNEFYGHREPGFFHGRIFETGGHFVLNV